MGKLVLVPTPIGNLEDITLRAIRMLQEADLVLAEDTRVTGKLLAHLQITTRMKPYHQANEHKVLDGVLSDIRHYELVVLVSDAGTPGISDPGFLLVRKCLEEHIDVEVLPGPSALLPALVLSGFPTDRFVFEGFLPHKKGRQTRILAWKEESRSVVFYESPHRLQKTLAQLADLLGEERRLSVSRELTKMFEQTIRGSIGEVKLHFDSHPVKGEFVVVLEGREAD